MKKILLEDALILSAVKFLRFWVHHLPLRVSLAIARAIGTAVYRTTKRRKIAHRNLRAAFAAEKGRDELIGIAKRSVQNLALSAVELLRFPDMDRAYIESHMRIEGTEKFVPVLRQGKGIVFLTAHFGNWELLNVASNLIGYPMMALARVQKHPRSDQYLNRLRGSQGGRIVYKGMSVREILKTLRSGGIVGILSDQDGGRNGSFVRFFGRLSSSPSGVATFALKTGAPIYPVFDLRDGPDTHHVEVEDALSMPDPSLDEEAAERHILQQFADVLERKIRRSPDQWLWTHRRWKSTPDRFVLALSDGKAGHVNQSRAVIDALRAERRAAGASDEQLHVRWLEVRWKSVPARRIFRAVCWLTNGRIPFKRYWLKAALHPETADAIERQYADIVVSCGSSIAGVNLLAKHENVARSLVIMRPPFGMRRFDAVIVPQHDGLRPGGTVFVTDKALSLISNEALEKGAARLAEELGLSGPAKKIGLLLGGDTERTKMDPAVLAQVLDGIEHHAARSGSVVLATTSRRTPAWADRLLKERLSDRRRCPFLVIANEKNRADAMSGILGLADVLVVSGESISMVSEAVASGKPVIVFKPSAGDERSKFRVFLRRLKEQKLVVESEPARLSDTLERELGHDGGWPYARLSRDRETIAQAVQKVVK